MLVVTLILSPAATAQRTNELNYKAHFTGLTSTAAEKFVIEAFHQQDPDMLLSLDRDLQQGKVRTLVALNETELAAGLAAHGITVELSVTWAGSPNGPRAIVAPGFPTPPNTGDPVQDDATYELAKQAWIQAHPALYSAMQQRATP